jgi:predicted porin
LQGPLLILEPTPKEKKMMKIKTVQACRLPVFFIFALSGFLMLVSPWFAKPAAGQTQEQGTEPGEPLPAGSEAPSNNWQDISERLSFVAQLDAYYSLSEQAGGGSLSGGGLSGVLAPVFRVNDRSTFLLLYNGEYYQRRDYYSDLVGPRERTEFQSHTITPMVKLDFGERSRYSLTPSFFFTWTYNKDVAGGGWDDGLYNYRDKGGGIDFRMKELGFGNADGALKLGLQYYQREYPNFQSLLDLATGIGLERDERDYDGTLARIGYAWGNKTGPAWAADYYLLYKDLEGKKVVDANGVLTDEAQKDYQHGLELRTYYVPAGNPGLRLGLDISGGLYRSNQNYYDGLGTIGLSDDKFMTDFYDYNSYGVRPNLSYTFSALPLTPSFSYAYRKTDFLGRLAQFPNGTYKEEKQEEELNAIEVGLRYDLLKNLSLYTRLQYLKVRSNNDDQTVYSYDHEVTNFYAGLSLRY